MVQTSQLLDRIHHGFIFVNVNDLDLTFGQRRDVREQAGR